MAEGTIFYHQNFHCPFMPTHNQSDQFHKMVLLICVDDKMKILFKGMLNVFKFCDPSILPIVLVVDDDLGVLVRQFALFQWRKCETKIDVIILSSLIYDYTPSVTLSKDTQMLHQLMKLCQFEDIANSFTLKKNLLLCCFGNGDSAMSDPLFYDAQIGWNDIKCNSSDNFLQRMISDIYQCFGEQTKNSSLIKCYLSVTTKPVTNHQPLKLSSKLLKRNEITQVFIQTDSTNYQQKVTPCYYCNVQFSAKAVKKHENCCGFRFLDINEAEFIVLIGIIGQFKYLGQIYANFIHHYFPKAFISYFFATDLDDFTRKVLDASFNKLKFFPESNKGRMFIFTFQDTIPMCDKLLPLFEKYENLVHVHHVFYAPVNEIRIDFHQMTPNTSLVFFNDQKQVLKILNMIMLCEKTDPESLKKFEPFLNFMSPANKATIIDPEVPSPALPKQVGQNQSERPERPERLLPPFKRQRETPKTVIISTKDFQWGKK
jgi:hypothetical protein